jgi:hypothetical protein
MYVMAGRQEGRSRKDRTMRDISPTTPNIDVTIGGELRVYQAYVTDADPSLDGPSTITLCASTLTELSWLAADPIVHDTSVGKRAARLVLIESTHRRWHRDSYRGAHCIFAPADPVLVSLKTLQHQLWLRLQASTAIEVCA